MHPCPECGLDHEAPVETVPVVVVAETEPEIGGDAAVEIARIEADKEIELAKISGKQAAIYSNDEMIRLEAENSALRRELEDLRMLATPPEPEPEPVVVAEPEPEPELIDTVPEPSGTPPPPSRKKNNPWW